MSKKETSQMTHIQLVNENKPKSVFYRGTESKKLPRVCSQCGITVNGKLTDLEQHWSENHTVVVGFDYTNQAWIKDGVYVDCGHPDIGQLVDPGQPGGPGGQPYIFKGCKCYGRLHKGAPYMVGASIHF